jgi:Lrp/AsnC family transcriptional regulator for asnA, asnC and gidA
MQPDEIDWKIINLLRESYQNNNAIASILGISEVLENQQLATVAVNVVESSQLESKAKEIAELPNVLDVSITSGRFDLFVQVLVDSNHGLVSFLTRELALVQGVSSTESFLMLKSFNKFV